MKTILEVCVIVVAATVATATVSATSEAISLPSEIIKDAGTPEIEHVYESVSSMPRGLKESLRKTFNQEKLLIAEPNARVRETDVVTADDAELPTRRFVIGFSTQRFQYIYYRAAGPENAGKLLVFAKHGNYYQRIWGGVEFNSNPRNPNDVLARVRHHAFDDKKDFFW